MSEIYESDIDQRPADSDEDSLMTADEWLAEFNANICCRRFSLDCPCGGGTHKLPPGASRLLGEEEEP